MKIKKGDINMKCSIPVYRQSGTTALERGEIAQFRESYQANILCKEAITKAISNHWDGMHLRDGAVEEVLEQFSADRITYVLAYTVQYKDWDERFSNTNRDWANAYTFPFNEKPAMVVDTHSCLTNGFIDDFRKWQKENSAGGKKK
jgi:hypothetical protein